MTVIKQQQNKKYAEKRLNITITQALCETGRPAWINSACKLPNSALRRAKADFTASGAPLIPPPSHIFY